jgi:hypothetical protein
MQSLSASQVAGAQAALPAVEVPAVEVAGAGAGVVGAGPAGPAKVVSGATSGFSWSNPLNVAQLAVPLAGALIQANAAGKAANTAANAAQTAANTNLSMFNTTNSQQAPWRQAGQNALAELFPGGSKDANGNPLPGSTLDSQLTHQFNASDLNANMAPNYQFQLEQGQGATKNAANLQTGLVSGNAMRGLQDYTQNTAAGAYQQAYNNYNTNQTNIFNRLSDIAGLGQTANANVGNVGSAAAGNAGNAQIVVGAAGAAGTIGTSNALAGGLNNALGWYSLPSLLQAQQNTRNSGG